jgi:hypothetical protein
MTSLSEHSVKLALHRFCLTFLMLIGTTAATASPPRPIGVNCNISSGALAQLYGSARIREITPELCHDTVTALVNHDELSLWTYNATSPQEETTLNLRVSDGPDEEVFITLTARRKSARPLNLEKTWLQPGDQHPPTADAARISLARTLIAELSRSWGTRVVDYLKTIPIAEARSLDPPGSAPVRIVSSLAWGRYQHLQGSQFMVVCSQTDHRFVQLTSRGAPKPESFRPDDAAAAYDALAVTVFGRWETASSVSTPIGKCRAELVGLTPLLLLFDRREDPDFETYIP